MNTLTRSDAKALAQRILKLVPVLQQKRYELFNKGELKPEEFLVIARYERRLLELVDDLSLIIFQEVLTDLKDPAIRLQKSTQKVQQALQTIEKANQFIGIAKGFVNLIGAVILAVKLGTPATLIGLVKALDDLLS
ncbi:MAG: hypothetical protein EWV48_21200 [Microcystis aeruginosa Ma_QC_C_20070823_S13]|jgi:hypothetical protein|nr:hypothetical protein [Microcystis aeruginosa G13-05]TRU55858.1 MAG: hypothetical protein EWV48_21200 [Microcystis aeruginosa Ma_QC_C_20070823_S13]TRU62805.1 MAG: hypothetical protein EWV56_06485 [Microcystis aeruginosa Ma_QC_C_20070823_S13D]